MPTLPLHSSGSGSIYRPVNHAHEHAPTSRTLDARAPVPNAGAKGGARGGITGEVKNVC